MKFGVNFSNLFHIRFPHGIDLLLYFFLVFFFLNIKNCRLQIIQRENYLQENIFGSGDSPGLKDFEKLYNLPKSTKMPIKHFWAKVGCFG